jgi:cobalt/nickel transport protein
MKRFLIFLNLIFFNFAFAHFGMIIPSNDIVEEKEKSNISLKILFAHPFEGKTMDMEKPVEFGVFFRGEKISLLDNLKETVYKFYSDEKSHKGWTLNYNLKRPGDYIFYCVPSPYWEPAEEKYIIHYTKVIVNGYGMEEGWDKEIGLKVEIVPLTRPYGIYTGNTFYGIVKFNGKVVPFCDVEIEYFNELGKVKAPYSPFITQVVKTDANGVFYYSFPKSGWYGFSAICTDEKKINDKEVEVAGVLWIKVYDMK